MWWVRYGLLGCVAAGSLGAWAGCQPSYLPGLPPGSPFAEADGPSRSLLPEGIAIGDVSSRSALLWVRTDGPATVTVTHQPTAKTPPPDSEAEADGHPLIRETEAARDYTLTVTLDGLRPSTAYRVFIKAEPESASKTAAGPHMTRASERATGTFTTLPEGSDHGPIQFGWSADLGGQTHCQEATDGYPIFEVLRRFPLQFFLLLGDTVYADEICPAPPNAPGSDFAALSLEAFRMKHRYQRRADGALRRFLATTPVFVVWDDHEVRNNFSGPYEERMPAGREALFDYWPIPRDPEDPHRLYRRFRAGAPLEVFLLDTRQYRSRNSDPDGPAKSMLGETQLAWLLEGLHDSTATWKVIASTVPLSVPKGGPLHSPGNDGWANGADGTGFETELKRIVSWIVTHDIRNVVWLAADVHFSQANVYDPDADGHPDFHEFVAGPLAAASGRMVAPRSPFPVQNLFHEGEFRSFGHVLADERRFEVAIIDESGRRRFQHRIEAR